MPEYSAIYETAIDRITSSYATCSKTEQKLMKQILEEMATTGYSYTLEQVWLSDFKEIPVGIDQFLNDPYYLGQTNNEGKNVYPFWRKTLNEIFSAGNQYYEIVLSGSTRIGKSSTSITIMAYMLYKLMLYRNPHEYFSKKAISKLTLAFANLTKELAFGVGYREFNDTLKESPWFMSHGSLSRSDRNFYYLPEGDKIEIIAASDGAQLLGRQIWCLKGDTKILTLNGVKQISECADTYQTVIQLIDQEFVPVEAHIQCTGFVSELIRVELEDGTIIEGTPDHKVMLSDGSYKELGLLTSSDDLLTFNINEEVDDMNLKDSNSKFIVYEHVSPEGKRYVGITSRRPQERWLSGGKGYKENTHFWNAIQKYGWDNFEHNILASDLSVLEACDMEIELIAKYDLTNPDKGYNHTSGGNWSTPDKETRLKLSNRLKEIGQDIEYRKKISDALKGHKVSQETREKISKANTGRIVSEQERIRKRNFKHTPETLEKLKSHESWSKGLTKETDSRVAAISEKLKGRQFSPEWRHNLSKSKKEQYENGYCPRWINNGVVETSIQASEPLPEGFVYGRLSKLDTYIYKGTESKKISHDDLESYIKLGWKAGRPKNVGENIRKSLQIMHWEYDGIRFETAKQLAAYLNNNGFPNIVDSTITSLYNKGFDKSRKYKSLEGKIRKILHEDKVNF